MIIIKAINGLLGGITLGIGVAILLDWYFALSDSPYPAGYSFIYLGIGWLIFLESRKQKAKDV